MRKCLFERGDLLERLDSAARKMGVETAEAEILDIKSLLIATMTEQQLKLFRAFDDAVVREGTLRVNAAFVVACACGECPG